MSGIRMEFSVINETQKLLAFTDPSLYRKAVAGGIKYAAAAVPTAVSKGITAAYNISAARVKKDVLGTSFVDDGETALIKFSRRPPTLSRFSPRPGIRGRQPGLGRGMGWGKPSPAGKQLTALVIRSEGRKVPAYGAFMAAGANGNQLVLMRKGEKLVSLYGPSIGSIFLGQSSIGPALREQVQARVVEQFTKGFQRALDAAARGYGI